MRLFFFTITTLLFFQHCLDDSPTHIRYVKGDFWPDNFRTNSYPSKAFNDDKVYCSSLESSDRPNFLYCLNLKNGKVDWAADVKSWATQPPIITDSFIYYCGYLGDIYKFDKQGNQLWYTKANSPYAEHCINPSNGNLIIRTVVNGLREFDARTGELIKSLGEGIMQVTLPVFSGNKIFLGLNDSLICLENTYMKTHWKIKTGKYVKRIFLIQDRIYYFDDTRSLNCVDAKNGDLLWQSDKLFGALPLSLKLLFENGKIICYSTDLNDTFYLLDTENGKLLLKATAEVLQQKNYLIPEIEMYKINGDNNITYDVFIENDLIRGDFRSSYLIRIKKKHRGSSTFSVF